MDKIITHTIPVAYVTTTISVNSDPQANRMFWLNRRRLLLSEVDGIEQEFDISPRTSVIRRWYKEEGNRLLEMVDDKLVLL